MSFMHKARPHATTHCTQQSQVSVWLSVAFRHVLGKKVEAHSRGERPPARMSLACSRAPGSCGCSQGRAGHCQVSPGQVHTRTGGGDATAPQEPSQEPDPKRRPRASGGTTTAQRTADSDPKAKHALEPRPGETRVRRRRPQHPSRRPCTLPEAGRGPRMRRASRRRRGRRGQTRGNRAPRRATTEAHTPTPAVRRPTAT